MNEGEWLSTQETAELWDRVIGSVLRPYLRMAGPQTVRKLCRNGRFEEVGIRVIKTSGGYYVNREDFLRRLEEMNRGTAERIEQEKSRPAGGSSL